MAELRRWFWIAIGIVTMLGMIALALVFLWLSLAIPGPLG